MLVLTNTYYDDIQKYVNVPGTAFPLAPTSTELANEFSNLDDFKSASDTIVYRSAKFRRLFREDVLYRRLAKFRIVKLAGTSLSDNEINSKSDTTF